MRARKVIFAIANRSKRASAIFIIVITLIYLASLSMILVGCLYLTNGQEEKPEFALPLLVVGFAIFFLMLVAIAITTICSNYVKKYPEKDPNKAD